MVQSDRPTTQSSNRHSRSRASAKMTLVNVQSRKTFSEISPPRKSRSRKALPSMRSSASGFVGAGSGSGRLMWDQVDVQTGQDSSNVAITRSLDGANGHPGSPGLG